MLICGRVCRLDPDFDVIRVFENLRFRSSTWMGVDKSMNIEHSGTFRNIPEHGIIIIIMRKKLCKTKFWAACVTVSSAQIGHVTLFFFSRAEQLLRNECARKNFPPWEINWKVYEVTDCWWYFEWRRECFNRALPRKFLSDRIKVQSKLCYSFKCMVDLLSNGRKSPSPCSS